MIIVPEHRARAGRPNSKQSVESLPRAAAAGIFRYSVPRRPRNARTQVFRVAKVEAARDVAQNDSGRNGTSALRALARLLGRVAAREALSTTTNETPNAKDLRSHGEP
jgi:hypothetical protein